MLRGDKLELNRPEVEWFSERPNRDAGRLRRRDPRLRTGSTGGWNPNPRTRRSRGSTGYSSSTNRWSYAAASPSTQRRSRARFREATWASRRCSSTPSPLRSTARSPTAIPKAIAIARPPCRTGGQALVLTQADPDLGSSRYAPNPLPTTIEPNSSGEIDLTFGNSYHADLIYKRGDDGSFIHVHPHCDRHGILRRDTSCTVIAPNGYQSPCTSRTPTWTAGSPSSAPSEPARAPQ